MEKKIRDQDRNTRYPQVSPAGSAPRHCLQAGAGSSLPPVTWFLGGQEVGSWVTSPSLARSVGFSAGNKSEPLGWVQQTRSKSRDPRGRRQETGGFRAPRSSRLRPREGWGIPPAVSCPCAHSPGCPRDPWGRAATQGWKLALGHLPFPVLQAYEASRQHCPGLVTGPSVLGSHGAFRTSDRLSPIFWQGGRQGADGGRPEKCTGQAAFRVTLPPRHTFHLLSPRPHHPSLWSGSPCFGVHFVFV